MAVAALARGLTKEGMPDPARIALLDLVAAFRSQHMATAGDALRTGTAHVKAVASLMLNPNPDIACRSSALLSLLLKDCTCSLHVCVCVFGCEFCSEM